MKLNENYANLKSAYLFSTIARKVEAFRKENPRTEIYKLGIGDVTQPIVPSIIGAIHAATVQMAYEDSFRGYGPEQGYDFVRDSVCKYYLDRGVSLDVDEVFISDGVKSDIGNIMELFDSKSRVMMPDPVYPAYLDANVMQGRKVRFAVGNKRNGFKPSPSANKTADIIYICSPNNPTGVVYTKEELKEWVDFALAQKAVILFDAAYEAYVRDEELPHSIYEIEGAKDCAIEFCSLSKTAGFTGLRCGYTVVPKALADGKLNSYWNRRQTTKFNGVSYIVQRGAEAAFTTQGRYEIAKQTAYYMGNAELMHNALKDAGVWHVGGENSPYIWLECPKNMNSWDYFDLLLNEANIIGTPGAGFGAHGEGYFRLTAFGNREKTEKAIARLVEVTSKNK